MTDLHYWTTRRAGRRQVLRTAGLGGAGLAAAALIGCSGDEPAAKAPAAPAGSATAAPVAAKLGGRLSILLDGAPPNFDVHPSTTNQTQHALAVCSNQLVQADPSDAWENPKGTKPDLAQSWEVSPDGMTYTFKLIKNAKFHDGAAFTAADVVATLQRNQTPPSGLHMPRQAQLKVIKTVETPDPYTLVLKTTRPVSPLTMLPLLGQGWLLIYSEASIKSNFDFRTKINGTGPYRLTEYKLGTQVLFEKNKNYHVPNRPYMDGVDIYVIPDASTQLAQTQAGNLLLNDRVFPNDHIAFKKSADAEKFTYPSIPVLSLTSLLVNTTRTPWKDDRVRQALSMSFDRNAAIQILQTGVGNVGGYMLPGGSWALPKEDFEKLPGYTPHSEAGVAEAKKLLAAAGVPANFKVPLQSGPATDNRATATYMISQIQKLGWEATVDIQDSATGRARLIAGEFDLASHNIPGAIDDPDTTFQEHLLRDAPSNFAKTAKQDVEDLFLKQTSELDPAKRALAAKDLQKAALVQWGMISIYWRNRNAIINKQVKDYTLHMNSYNNERYENVWLDK